MSHHPSLAAPVRAHRRTAWSAALVIIALMSFLSWATPAFAARPTFTDFQVSVWPEYDDPRVLSIFESDLDQSVQLPYRFSYAIPTGAQVGMTCQLTPAGQHQ